MSVGLPCRLKSRVIPAALNIDCGVEVTVTVPLPRYMAPYRLDLIADLVNTGEWFFVGWLSAFVLHRQQGIAMLGYGHDGSVHQCSNYSRETREVAQACWAAFSSRIWR